MKRIISWSLPLANRFRRQNSLWKRKKHDYPAGDGNLMPSLVLTLISYFILSEIE
jgi:hypothetical protein